MYYGELHLYLHACVICGVRDRVFPHSRSAWTREVASWPVLIMMRYVTWHRRRYSLEYMCHTGHEMTKHVYASVAQHFADGLHRKG
jgi:uncharacterized membrane protein YjdF